MVLSSSGVELALLYRCPLTVRSFSAPPAPVVDAAAAAFEARARGCQEGTLAASTIHDVERAAKAATISNSFSERRRDAARVAIAVLGRCDFTLKERFCADVVPVLEVDADVVVAFSLFCADLSPRSINPTGCGIPYVF